MEDGAPAGHLAVNPITPPNGAPPPSYDDAGVGKEPTFEKDLIKEALAELDGEVPKTETTEQVKTKAEPDKKPEEQTQKKLSDGFAKLAAREERHDRRVAEDTAKAREREAAYEAREARLKPMEEAYEKAKSSPLEALQTIGWSYKELVDYVMADGKIPPEKFAERLSQQQKTELDAMKAELESIKQSRNQERDAYESQQEMARNEHSVRTLFADGGQGIQRYPTFAHHFRRDPGIAQRLMVDVNNALTQHFNETCVRDEKGRIIKPGEKLDAERAVAYLEGILGTWQVPGQGNPGQPGAVPQTAKADAARQSEPKPLTPRDLSVTSMPSDDELSKMSQEELDALSLRIYKGG